MKRLITAVATAVALLNLNAYAVTPAEDIAATINLNGYACGNTASDIKETVDADGNKTITASCENSKRYQINISNKGRVSIKPL